MWASVLAGISLGALGSLHCVGMCGPLALALPVYHLTGSQRLISLLAYHAGRVTTYGLLGLLFGIAGRGFYLAGFQQWLSLGLGILILASVFFAFFRKQFFRVGLVSRFYFNVQQAIGNLMQSGNTPTTFFVIGMANGLLPCGMIYMAVAGALSTVNIFNSVLFMVFFGLGTLPAMLVVSYFGKMISLSARMSMRKALPFVMVTMGLLLILRGLHFDIPFISPVLPAAPAVSVGCHS